MVFVKSRASFRGNRVYIEFYKKRLRFFQDVSFILREFVEKIRLPQYPQKPRNIKQKGAVAYTFLYLQQPQFASKYYLINGRLAAAMD